MAVGVITFVGTQDPSEFLDLARGFLEAHPRRNNVILNATASAIELKFTGSQYYAPAADGVMGVEGLAAVFAETWTAITGQEARRAISLHLYSLEDVLDSARRPEGRGRRAVQSDRDLVLPWFTEFARDAGLSAQQIAGAEQSAARLLAAGAVFLWEVDGQPKAMTSHTEADAAIGRINAVYVPEHLRGGGHASACVRYVSRYLREEKNWPYCVLFANVDDPSANRLYRSVGFSEVCQFQEYDFISPT